MSYYAMNSYAYDASSSFNAYGVSEEDDADNYYTEGYEESDEASGDTPDIAVHAGDDGRLPLPGDNTWLPSQARGHCAALGLSEGCPEAL